MADSRDTEKQDVETLKRRGRRRLVGAIALVLVAVIVLPMVFDAEPKRAPPVSVRIPSEDDPGFKPKVVPKPPAVEEKSAQPRDTARETNVVPAQPIKPAPPAQPAAQKAQPDAKAAKGAESGVPSEAERRRAEAALANEQFVVPVAALASAEKLKDLVGMLEAAKLPHYTEPVATEKGSVTRVRAGPFATRELAQQAHAKLQGLGLKPGNVIAR